MALYKIKDFDPNYRNHFDGDDVKDLDLYSGDQRIGSVDDVMVDEDGRFRYLVINTGGWFFGKKVLPPIGRTRIDYNARRVYAEGLTKEQVENLPEFSEDMKLDYDYEEQVRGVYRPTAGSAVMGGAAMGGVAAGSAERPVESRTGLNTPTPLDSTIGMYDRDSYRYEQEPNLFEMNERNHQNMRLYEERLIANKRREKAGEVAIGKHVETETARVSVPVERERVVVERTTPHSATPVDATDAAFQEGEVARVEVYEEVPDIHKEAFVREEVQVKKVVEQDTVEAEDQIRREQLDINRQGQPVVDERGNRI
jgi:uncharacterized protein (TIGR02271 family)